MSQDQVERLIRPRDGEVQTPDDGISPKMPFPTGYVLDRYQEEELVNHAMKRLQELEKESGRYACGGNSDWANSAEVSMSVDEMQGVTRAARSWMGKRTLYDLTYKNEVDFRATLIGGIFADSNLVVPVARRTTRQMIARAVNYYFGTDPWFAIYPVGALDRERADKADRYTRWKMDQAKLKRTEEMALERAFIVGEGVVKTAHVTRSQTFKTKALVLVDEQGMDILGQDGDYIFEQDLWIEAALQDPETGEMVPSGMLTLKRDGVTPKPATMTFVEKLVTRKIVHYKGPEAKVLHFMDFLCPLEAPTVQEADCCVHLYDISLMELADQWSSAIADGASAEERQAELSKSVQLLRELSSAPGRGETAQNSNQIDSSTANGSKTERTDPMVHIAEFHLRYDINGDGILEDVMLVVDKASRTPIFYDYEGNVTPDGLRPFTVVRVNEVLNRWYGIGSMEMFNPSQQVIDLMINRWNASNSRTGSVTFWNPENTVEGRGQANLELNGGGTYTPKPGKTAKDCLEVVRLDEKTGELSKELAEFFMQMTNNESGVSNANDGQVAGMDSTKLATGIRNIEKSGQELFSLHLGHAEPGVSEVLSKMVKLQFAHLDETEIFRYFEEGEGGEGGGEMREINAGDLANIEIDTRILLTRYRGEQILESSIRAVEITERYYAMMPEVQIRTQKMFQDMLKALQVANANEVIQPLPIPMPGAGGMPPAGDVAKAAAGKPRQGEPNL